jgi:hypothetical protein
MKINELAKAFDEMFDFITDLPSGLDGFESDFDKAYEKLKLLKSDGVQEVKHGKWELIDECAIRVFTAQIVIKRFIVLNMLIRK